MGFGVYYGIMGIYYMGIMEKKMEATIMGCMMGYRIGYMMGFYICHNLNSLKGVIYGII